MGGPRFVPDLSALASAPLVGPGPSGYFGLRGGWRIVSGVSLTPVPSSTPAASIEHMFDSAMMPLVMVVMVVVKKTCQNHNVAFKNVDG